MLPEREPRGVSKGARLLALVSAAALLLPWPAFTGLDERLERLPEKYRKWLEQESVYIISPRERDAFLDLQSVEEWEAFITAFWRRRDPDPLTPVNEFREEHFRRIEHVNRYFGRESAVPGWMTDRGKMYIILGEPNDREAFPNAPGIYPVEVWFYQGDRERALPPLNLLFFQEHNAGPYRLFNHVLDQPEDLMPAQPLNRENARTQAYEFLQEISPDLAQAAFTIRADEGVYANIYQSERAGLDVQMILADIEKAPFRRVDTSYVDAAEEARGIVESDYLFNYVPSSAVAHVLPGPGHTRFVHYALEIDSQHMTLARDEDKKLYYTRFEIRGEVTTIDGENVVFQFVKEPHLNVTEAQFQGILYRPFSYRDMFPLASGDFRFRIVLKNQARSEYTIFETELAVSEATGTASLYAPVLLYGSEELADPTLTTAYRTYQLGSLRLDPNPKAAYVSGEELLVYIPVEDAKDDHRISLRITGRDDASQQLESETVPIGRYGGKPIVESFPLAGIPGGRYRLEVDLRSAAGEVLDTAFADFDLSPRTSIPRPWTLRESFPGEQRGLTRTMVADQYLMLGDRTRARALYEQAVRDDPDFARPRLVLARFRLDENEAVEAIRLLEPAHAQSKEDVEVLLTLADAYAMAKDCRRASELYEASIVLRTPSTSVLTALGLCLAQTGDAVKAIGYLERSLAIDANQDSVKEVLERLKSSLPPSHRK
jgi:GWxTD domain-containing protein